MHVDVTMNKIDWLVEETLFKTNTLMLSVEYIEATETTFKKFWKALTA